MSTNKFNKKPHFPFTYGDKVDNDDTWASNMIIKVAKNKKVQRGIVSLGTGI